MIVTLSQLIAVTDSAI